MKQRTARFLYLTALRFLPLAFCFLPFAQPVAASPAATLSPGADPAVSFALTSSREELVRLRSRTVYYLLSRIKEAVAKLPS